MTRLTRRGALGLGVAGSGGCGLHHHRRDIRAYVGKATFGHGVASGDPTQTAVIIWTRVTPEADGPVPVTWSVSQGSGLQERREARDRSPRGQSAITR